MNKRIPISMVILGVLALTWIAFPITLNAASNYYVATTGNDSDNGTQGNPWKTITHAVSQASTVEIDTINVAEGTYSNLATGETFPITVSKSVVIQATGSVESTIVNVGGGQHGFNITTDCLGSDGI